MHISLSLSLYLPFSFSFSLSLYIYIYAQVVYQTMLYCILLDYVTDLLREQAHAERLYDQVVAHFDVRRRTTLLNERLSYSMDFLHTLGEHVRHLYSVRLETMIIVIIALELAVGIMGLWSGFGPHGAPPAPPVASREGERSSD